MAKFEMEMPTQLVNNLEDIYSNVEEMLGEMTKAGAKVVYKNIKENMKNSFKSTKALEKGLKITKTYKTKSDDAVNTKVGFYGYDDSKKTKQYPDGVPIPLIASAREYGTSSGERKKPFLRKAFKDEETISNAMIKVQERYIKDE